MGELPVVERQIEAEREQNTGASGSYNLTYKREVEEELTELDYVFAYFDRLRNGYHLTPAQTVIFMAFTSLAVYAGWLLLMRGG